MTKARKDSAFLKLISWFDANRSSLPWRASKHQTPNPYHVLVSEIMLQQTQIAVVSQAFPRFLKSFPHIEALAEADSIALRQATKGLGYYRRFENLHRAAKVICDSGFPHTREGWLGLPGVGPYTAAAVASIVYDEPCGVVDGNIERILARVLRLREAKGSNELKKICQDFMNAAIISLKGVKPGAFNQAMMELGQKICKPQAAQCFACPLATICQANLGQGSPLDLPAKAAPKPKINLNFFILPQIVVRGDQARFLKNTEGFSFIVEHNQQFYLNENPSQKVNPPPAQAFLPIGKHAITNHKILLFKKQNDKLSLKEDLVLTKISTSLDQKILQHSI